MEKKGAGVGSVVVAVSFLFFSYTPNNKNVVIEKWKKGKSQKGINSGDKPNEFIGSVRTWTSYLPVWITHCFKAERQYNWKFQRGNATTANESENVA